MRHKKPAKGFPLWDTDYHLEHVLARFGRFFHQMFLFLDIKSELLELNFLSDQVTSDPVTLVFR